MNYGLSEYDFDDDDWQVSPPTLEIRTSANRRLGRARRYSVGFWHGDEKHHVLSWVVDDGAAPVFVVIDDTLLFVCGCKLGGVASDRHTCGKYDSDEAWIGAAVERYIEDHPELFPPEPLNDRDRPPPRSVWAQLLDDD